MAVSGDISDRLLAECIGRPRAPAELQWLCDNVGGRTSGAESGHRAEEWAHHLLRRWGLANVRFDSFPVTVWTRGSIDAEVLGSTGWRLTALAHGNAPRAADVTAHVVDVGHGEREQWLAATDTVGGAIALCDEGASAGRRPLHRTEKLGLAIELGAAGLMIVSSAPGGLPRTGVCHEGESPIPSAGISLEDGERLRRLLKAGAAPEARVRMANGMARATARNVLADLPGSEAPGEVVLAGAHLDSWDVAQGATDNGLGTAIVLEAARALAAVGRAPRRTLRFALWAAEEVGLLGSRRYAERNADVLADHVAVMNFDMTGDPFGYWTPGREEPAPLLRGLVAQLAGLGMREEWSHRAGLHSDHQPFMLAGVPVVGLQGRIVGDGGHYYHSVGDTFEKVSLPALARAAAVAAHTLWALADAPERPYAMMDPAGVRAMVEEAGLREALEAEGYDGPPMRA